MSSTSAMRAAWDLHPASSRTVTLELGASTNGARITVRTELAVVFRAVDQIMQRHRYNVDRTQTGSYVKRKITGGSGSSLHAHAIAVDYNWRNGPFRRIRGRMTCAELTRRNLTDMPCAMVADIRKIKTRDGLPVLRWGGDYTSVKDCMHWEAFVTPAQLRSGIVVPGVDDQTEEDDVRLVRKTGTNRVYEVGPGGRTLHPIASPTVAQFIAGKDWREKVEELPADHWLWRSAKPV